MRCPSCGVNQKGKFKFCGFCGAEFKQEDKPVETSILKKPISELFRPSTAVDKQTDFMESAKPEKSKNIMEQVEVPKDGDSQSQTNKDLSGKQPKLNSDDFFNKPLDEIKSAQQPMQQPTQPTQQIQQPTTQSIQPTQPTQISQPIQPVEEKANNPVKAVNPITHSLSDDYLEEEIVKHETVKIIDTVGQNKITAKSMLEYLGLAVEIQTKNSVNIPYGDVMSQDKKPGTKVDLGSIITLVTSVGTWTAWSNETIPVDKLHKFDVEEKIQYRSRTRKQTVDYKESRNKDEFAGYEIYETKNVFSDWVEDDYYVSEKKETSELCELSSKMIGFKYCGWNYTGDELDIIESFGTAHLALAFNNETSINDWAFKEIISKQDADVAYTKWHNADDNGTLTPANDIVIANISIAGYDVGEINYALKYGTKDSEWFKYKTREIVEHIYSFKMNVYTEWSEWGEWSCDIIEENDLTEVDTQKIYRFRRKASLS